MKKIFIHLSIASTLFVCNATFAQKAFENDGNAKASITINPGVRPVVTGDIEHNNVVDDMKKKSEDEVKTQQVTLLLGGTILVLLAASVITFLIVSHKHKKEENEIA